MNNTLVLHTGSDCLEQEYAEYIKDRVGGGTCTGLSELGDISSFEEIICIFRYSFQNAALPEPVEDLLFERAGEIAGKKVKFIGFGERSDGFRRAVEELSGMCGVEADCRFLKETAHIYTEHTDREDGRVVFVRELAAEEDEAGQPADASGESVKAKQPAAASAETAEEPAEIPAEKTEEISGGESGTISDEKPEEVPYEEASLDNKEASVPAAAGTYMDEAALAEAIRAVIAESEEMISQVTDEVSAEFPDEEEAEDEGSIEESEEPGKGGSDTESGSSREESFGEAQEADDGQVSREAGGPVRDSGDDTYDDWDPGKDSRIDRDGGQIGFEEPFETDKEEPAGEILPEETVQEEPSHDTVGQFSWELKSGEALKKYIRRANGEEPWPETDYELPLPKKEPAEGKSYRFIDESVTVPEEAAYEAPLGLSDLEALEAEEAAEEVNRRERRKVREDEPEEGIIARAAAKILAFFRGSRDEEDEELDFDDEEKETKKAKSGEKSFLERLRDDVGVYDDDDEDLPEDGEEPESDYDEDDEEDFDDDEVFSDSLEEDEDEDDF